MIRTTPLALAAAAVLAASPAALAAPVIDEAGAAAFKATLAQAIADYGDVLALSMGPGAQEIETIMDGELTVEVAEGYYAATLPSLRFVSQQDGLSATFNVGTVAINAVPGEEDGVYTMAIALPSPMTAILTPPAEAGEPLVLEWSVAEQRDYTVQWDSRLDARWGVPFAGALAGKIDHRGWTVAGATSSGDMSVTIDAVRGGWDYRLDEAGLATGPMELSLEGWAYDLPEADGKPADVTFRLGALTLSGQMTEVDIGAAMAGYRTLMNSAQELHTFQAAIEAGQEPDMSVMLTLADAYGAMLGNLLSGVDVSYRIQDLSFDAPAPAAPGGRMALALGSAEVGMGFADLMGDAGRVSKHVTFSGLSFTPPPPGVAPAIPSAGSFTIEASKIPAKTIAGMVRGALASAAENPEMGQMAFMGLTAKLPGLLASTGTKVTLSDTGARNATYRVTADGSATASMEAPMGAVANLLVRFEGLEALIAALEGQAEADPNVAGDVMPMLMSLGQAQMMGAQEGAADVYTYDFQLGTDGVPTLNGQPLQ